MKKIVTGLLSLLLLSCGQTKYKNPHVLIVTAFGDIEVELYPDKAPKTVAAFLSYVDSGFYSNSSFYRVVLAEGMSAASNAGIVQGGIWQTNDKLHPFVKGVEHESTKQTGLTHTDGTISLARTAAGTGNTEFFICVGDQSQLDYGNENMGDTLGFAAFGKVYNGMPVVRKIQQEKSHDQHFDNKILIQKIARL